MSNQEEYEGLKASMSRALNFVHIVIFDMDSQLLVRQATVFRCFHSLTRRD